MASIEFLKDILAGRKRLIKKNQIRYIQKLERFHELTVNNLVDYGMNNINNFGDYLPANHDEAVLSRSYLINVDVSSH
jgi:hypothetical protein